MVSYVGSARVIHNGWTMPSGMILFIYLGEKWRFKLWEDGTIYKGKDSFFQGFLTRQGNLWVLKLGLSHFTFHLIPCVQEMN